ncbi:hypothetical protein [uncultured Desulfobacter sp.]|uniref:hypothetical protein n=1 Tax=uncultured Desulfobacter sp. TaxID=240139 RepID=UPI0029F4B716|nr:hypothetical protein [uncultured Desulfobacter sp.]
MPRHPLNFDFKSDSRRAFKQKSKIFKNVQDALDKYVDRSTMENLQNLIDKLGVWKRSKVDGTNNWKNSIRYKQVNLLSEWIVKEATGPIFPVSRDVWEKNTQLVNCYAYAMNCMLPVVQGNNSWPGRFAGEPAKTPARIGYDFADGVIADAKKQGKKVIALRRGGQPGPVPIVCPDGKYLVAMVSTPYGYHFLRRNESTGLWSHKNGAWNEVETYFYDRELEQPMPITNDVVLKLLKNPRLMECDMSFDSYLAVPPEGLMVTGKA